MGSNSHGQVIYQRRKRLCEKQALESRGRKRAAAIQWLKRHRIKVPQEKPVEKPKAVASPQSKKPAVRPTNLTDLQFPRFSWGDWKE